jgi:hypothetical protein
LGLTWDLGVCHTEDNDKPTFIIIFCLFCFYAPRKNNEELAFMVVFFGFISMHLEKTMMNLHSLSFFNLFLCTEKKQPQASIRHHFLFIFVSLHL